MAYIYRGDRPIATPAPPKAARPRLAGEFLPREPAPLYPCGTDAAYRRHIFNNEQPCMECCDGHKSANKEYVNLTPEQRQERKAPLTPCGTESAFNRHFARDEHIDRACRDARNEYQRDLRARKAEAAAAPADWAPCECGHAWKAHTPHGCTYGTRPNNPARACQCTTPQPIGENK